MKLTIPMLTAVVAAAGLTAATAAGRPMGGPPPHGPGLHLERAIYSLDLTAAQEKAIEELLDARRAEMEARRDQTVAAHEALHEAIISETLDEGAIRNAAAAVAALISNQAVEHARLLNEVRSLLTTDQRDELEDLLSRPLHPFHGQGPGTGHYHGGHGQD